MKTFRFLIPLSILLLGGCAPHVADTMPHVCRYQEAEAKIVWLDHHGWMIEHNGTKQEIKIKQPSREFELLMALDYKITALEYASDIKEKSRIYAVGRLSSCIHSPLQKAAPKAELAMSCLHTGDDHKYRNFVLEYWYLKKPFYEAHHDEYPNESAWKITKRTALQASDFNHRGLANRKIVPKEEDWKQRVR